MDSKTDAALTRMLSKKIGPVDLTKVIGSKPIPVQGKTRHVIILNNRRIDDNEADALKREAELIEQTQLYKMWMETLRYEAQTMMFEKSQKSEDIFITGKFFLHCLSTLEHIIEACKNPMLMRDQITLSTAPRRKPIGGQSLTGNNNNT